MIEPPQPVQPKRLSPSDTWYCSARSGWTSSPSTSSSEKVGALYGDGPALMPEPADVTQRSMRSEGGDEGARGDFGGEGGEATEGGGAALGPQSEQSDPSSHSANSAPGPPSSHSLSKAQ